MAKKRKKKSSRINIEEFEKKIVSASKRRRPLRMGIYGRPGTGKTTFCATAPHVLIVDCEQGTMSIEDTGVKVIEIKEFEDMNLVYWFLAKGDHNFKSVAIDSLTSLQAMGLDFVLNEAASLDLTKDPKMADRRDYGKLNKLMIDIINNFRSLPMHVIMTAHERSREEEDGDVEIYPLMTPGTRSHFEGVIDVIGRLYTREIEVEGRRGKPKRKVVRRLLVGPHSRYISKARAPKSSRLPPIIKDPTFPVILKKIRGG